MTDAGHYARLEQLFHEAVELPASDRAAFVKQRSGDDDDLRQELEQLIVRDDEGARGVLAEAILETPSVFASGNHWADRPTARKYLVE